MFVSVKTTTAPNTQKSSDMQTIVFILHLWINPQLRVLILTVVVGGRQQADRKACKQTDSRQTPEHKHTHTHTPTDTHAHTHIAHADRQEPDIKGQDIQSQDRYKPDIQIKTDTKSRQIQSLDSKQSGRTAISCLSRRPVFPDLVCLKPCFFGHRAMRCIGRPVYSSPVAVHGPMLSNCAIHGSNCQIVPAMYVCMSVCLYVWLSHRLLVCSSLPL